MSGRFVAPLPEERKAKLSGSANVTPERTVAASIPTPPPQHPARGSVSTPSGPDIRMLSRPSSPSPSVSSSRTFDKDGSSDDNLNLTDEELRKLYEDEEVEWFLRLFSKVRLYPRTNCCVKPQGHTKTNLPACHRSSFASFPCYYLRTIFGAQA